ncbi:MAG: hypothetical protein IJI36_09550 [Kiritimatiellae bacterium]|nr:hypothetical protein [Kiritimatiellia bacterium]
MKNLLLLAAGFVLGALFAADGSGTSAVAILIDTTDHDGSATVPLVETRAGVSAATAGEETVDTVTDLGSLLIIR